MKRNTVIGTFAAFALFVAGCSNPALSTPADDGGRNGEPQGAPGAEPEQANVAFTMDLSGIPSGDDLINHEFSGDTTLFAVDADGMLETTNDGSWATLEFPRVGLFDRNQDGGVVVDWSISFPSYDGGRWKEKNKHRLTLLDDEGLTVFQVEYKPNSASQMSNDNIILSDSSGALASANSGTVPPFGSDAADISFRLVITPTTESGGDGSVELFYDESGSGIGADPLLTATSDLLSRFTTVQLTHRNTASDPYQLVFKSLSIAGAQ